MTRKVLVTDYVWPSTDPERAVIEAGGAELVIAPDSDEAVSYTHLRAHET